MTESPLLSLSAAVTHFNSTLFLSHWNPSTMTFNKGRRVKTWLFLHILSPRLGRGPSKGINQCSLTALPSGNDLSLFCAQKWHINLKMDMHKLYIQLLRLCFCAQAEELHEGRRPVRLHVNNTQTSLFVFEMHWLHWCSTLHLCRGIVSQQRMRWQLWIFARVFDVCHLHRAQTILFKFRPPGSLRQGFCGFP